MLCLFYFAVLGLISEYRMASGLAFLRCFRPNAFNFVGLTQVCCYKMALQKLLITCRLNASIIELLLIYYNTRTLKMYFFDLLDFAVVII